MTSGLSHDVTPRIFTVGSSPVVVEISCPQRGSINAMRVLRLSGFGTGFFRLYNRQSAALADASNMSSMSDSAGAPAARPVSSAVMPAKAVDGEYEEYGLNYHYQNRDAPRQQGRLWLVFTPSGSDETTYELTMTVVVPIM